MSRRAASAGSTSRRASTIVTGTPAPARSRAVSQPSSQAVKTTARRRRSDAEPVEIGPHRAREHDARPVVAAEHDRPLDRPRGKHGAPGDDPPGALTRAMSRRHRQMIAHPFERAIGAVIVDAEHCRPRA